MKARTRFIQPLLATASALLLAGCNEEKPNAEIKELTEEIETLRDDVKFQRERLEKEREKVAEARNETSEMRAQLREAESKLSAAENELERYRRQEELAREKEEAKPDRKELLAQAKETVAGYRDLLIDIAGDATKGTGVLVEADGKTWIYGRLEVVRGNNRLEVTTRGGATLKRFGTFEIGVGSPWMRLEVIEDPPGGLPLAGADTAVERNTPLLAFDADGNLVDGRCYGAASDGSGLRVDSKLGDLPPGSAIFHGESGKLVGLLVSESSVEPSLWPNPYAASRDLVTLRRIDGGGEWAAIPIGNYLKEARTLERIDDISRLMHAFATTRVDATGITYGDLPGRLKPEELMEQHASEPAVKSLRSLDAWLKDNAARSSAADLKHRIGAVFKDIDGTARRIEREFKEIRFSPANSDAARRSLKWHEEAREELDSALKDLE